MHGTIMKFALIGRWTRMRPFPGSFSRTEPSIRSPFSAGFIITTFRFNFQYGQPATKQITNFPALFFISLPVSTENVIRIEKLT